MWKLGSVPLMKTSLDDPVWPLGGAKPLSGILPGRLLPARSALWIPRDLSNLMARPEFGEFWRIHVILFLCRILAPCQNLLTNGNTQIRGHLS